VSPSLYGFVKSREPVSPEEVASDFLSLESPNGDARAIVERLVDGDPRFGWEDEVLRTVDPASLALEEAPYVIFDVETTGPAAGKGGAITEFGALKVVHGEVVEEFSTLVNPGRPIDPFVVRLTGITDRMVADAPTVSEVMPRFERFVEGSVLVGHNVHFDCSFVAAARGGVSLPNPVLDTLKLSRCLVPGLKRYRLSSLVGHFGVRQVPNHRALSDAAATVGVFLRLLKLLRTAGVESVGEAATIKGGRGRIKPQKQHLVEGVPGTPGVYYFVDKHGTVLYVGKAKDLKARVRTYFNGGDGRRKIGRLVEEVAEVRVRETESELHALILEAREIKRLLPRYNSAGRDDKASWFIRLDTSEPYPVPERVSTNAPEEGVVHLGPYRSAGVLDTCIEALGRIFPLKRCSGEGGSASTARWAAARRASAWTSGVPSEVVDEVVALLARRGRRGALKGAGAGAGAARPRARVRGGGAPAGSDLRHRARAAREGRRERRGRAGRRRPFDRAGRDRGLRLLGGRLVAHRGFEAADTAGLAGFAEEVLARPEEPGPAAGKEGSNEARIVAAYLRRRSTVVEAVRLRRRATSWRRWGGSRRPPKKRPPRWRERPEGAAKRWVLRSSC
jgi:DNA polymerase-3 subunit epsilon